LFFDYGVTLNGGYPQPPQDVEGSWLEVDYPLFYTIPLGDGRKFGMAMGRVFIQRLWRKKNLFGLY